jgi:hypothetical protein
MVLLLARLVGIPLWLNRLSSGLVNQESQVLNAGEANTIKTCLCYISTCLYIRYIGRWHHTWLPNILGRSKWLQYMHSDED